MVAGGKPRPFEMCELTPHDCRCVLYKEGQYEAARQKFMEAMSTLGYQPELQYNICLCYYKTKQYGQVCVGAGMHTHACLRLSCRWLVCMHMFKRTQRCSMHAVPHASCHAPMQALKLISEIIERGVREHPELSVGR